MRQVGSVLWPRLRTVQIYGANTGVGKTVVSTLLCKALRRRFPAFNVNYLKPISTGPLDEADNRHLSTYCDNISTKTLLQFDDPVSPHIAARSFKEAIDDRSLLARIHSELTSYAADKHGFAVVETAGGVLSPAPSGSTQADFYRPLRLPVLLVGDHRLGGIGGTISAWESLHIRGYDVDSVMLFEDETYQNHGYLKEYFDERNIPTLSLPPPPQPAKSPEADIASMKDYYDQSHRHESMDMCIDRIMTSHQIRLDQLQSLPNRAEKSIWHPFMQHTERSSKNILAIDSAYGDHFATLSPSAAQADTTTDQASLLTPAFDGSASWWTQGLGHGNPALALTAAHTAGRYGHVMFANAAHEPAVSLAEMLLENIGNPRLTKVFYTDNGSAGMEVAVKMALKAASKRNGWKSDDEVLIIGLKGSYHGDTMGTMDCSEPSVYNTKVEWYQPRGHWFDFPQVKMQKGKWVVETPTGMEEAYGVSKEYATLDEVFDLSNRSKDALVYQKYLSQTIKTLSSQGKKFGALIMEPVILGAGGMLFADPLFQHVLASVVRDLDTTPRNSDDWSGMPIIHDEIFTGLYRLGRMSSSTYLQIHPDISTHAKLLTGGLLPLCTTLASESIFEAFLSAEKSDALLHGHSYTAHAIGCNVACHSVGQMMDMEKKGKWDGYKSDWNASSALSPSSSAVSGPAGPSEQRPATEGKAWSMWSKSFVTDLSYRDDVESVIALGSVLAISMQDPAGAGYTSLAGAGLRDKLLKGREGADSVIHSRILGNVLYLMASITSPPETLREVERMVVEALG